MLQDSGEDVLGQRLRGALTGVPRIR